MRIAVTYEDGNIFQHFGHTEQFKIYDVSNGQIMAEQTVSSVLHSEPPVCLISDNIILK